MRFLLLIICAQAFATFEGCEQVLIDLAEYKAHMGIVENKIVKSKLEEEYELKINELAEITGTTKKQIEEAYPEVTKRTKKVSIIDSLPKRQKPTSNKEIFRRLAETQGEFLALFEKMNDLCFQFEASGTNPPFEMQATPVTQAQWYLAALGNPSKFNDDGIMVMGNRIMPNRPVEQVSWSRVQHYLKGLNDLNDGYHYRLPTEAEWEYMARAGSTTKYFWGDDDSQLDNYAWYPNNAAATTHNVAEKLPNLFGMYDIYGNVQQWCEDAVGDTRLRILRGGSFQDLNSNSVSKNQKVQTYRDETTGFRVVRIKKP